MLTDFIFYSLVILGGGATVGGIIWDLTRGHRNLRREAERESRRMNHTEKISR